ncbi:hypothetical protein BS78_03G248600 [Paspalum vaginatum]|nr:hypothetical protein BS78_03G248600 [Paspalum vaginatum]
MRLPENNGRLFVGGIAPGTGDVDLRRHFCRYGEVAEICLPKHRPTGLTRGFAFVQFLSPTDAGRALADPHHVIIGQQVRVARAKPRAAPYKPLCDRIHRVRNHGYRVGDIMKIKLGPMSGNYEECEYVKKLREFGDIIDNTLTFECIIGYISEDGKECLVRWPPVQSDDKQSALSSGQGDIIPSFATSLKELAQFSSTGNLVSAKEDCRYCLEFWFPGTATAAHYRSGYPNAGSVGHAPGAESIHPTYSTKDGQSQNCCWLVFRS